MDIYLILGLQSYSPQEYDFLDKLLVSAFVLIRLRIVLIRFSNYYVCKGKQLFQMNVLLSVFLTQFVYILHKHTRNAHGLLRKFDELIALY